jgi:carbonic anhydrase/acetyltransferase-like protein (isoleucine patch superfamily)
MLVDTSLRRVVAQPGSTLSNLGLSDVIIGRDVFLTTAVSFYGPAPGHDVMVEGRDTGRALLGGAIGARAVLGARALLAAGLALPPGIIVVSKPDEAAAKLDDAGLARAHMRWGDRATDV